MSVANTFVFLYPLVTILSVSGYIPQIIKLLRAQTPQDSIALSGWFAWIANTTISLGYGVYHLKDLMYSITTGVSLTLLITTVSLVLYNRHLRFKRAAAAIA